MSDLAWAILPWGVPLVGAVMTWKMWKHGFSAYDQGGPLPLIIGRHGRYGFDPFASYLVLTVGTVFALAFTLDALPRLGAERLGATLNSQPTIGVGAGLFMGGVAISLSQLLFLFPRFLTPPHLRDKRGWTPEWWASRRARSQDNTSAG